MSKHRGRAQQFLPYASLRGFDEVVARARHISTPRREVAEDRAEELSRALSEAQKGDPVRICYYVGDHYETRCGTFRSIDMNLRAVFVDGESVPIDDIFSFERNWDL